MQVVGLPSAFYRIASVHLAELSPEARRRLERLRAWQALREAGLSSTQASMALGLPRATLFRWQRRLQRAGPPGLEPWSRRPHQVRPATWSPPLVQAVLGQREQYPRWGKEKLTVLLQAEGWTVSAPTVGRILAHLKRRGLLHELPRPGLPLVRHRRHRPYALRKPRGYAVHRPGDLVQLDTLEVRPLPGVILRHFTACDVVSRWGVLGVHTRATAKTAAGFLDALLARMPFPVRAIQVDGGSEFQAAFEEACQQRNIRLFVLPPHSPKLNGCVERAHRTHQEEFYELHTDDWDLASLTPALHAGGLTGYDFVTHNAARNRVQTTLRSVTDLLDDEQYYDLIKGRLEKGRLDFVHSPDMWNDFKLATDLDWSRCVEFTRDNLGQVPNDRCGLYSFILEPRFRGAPPGRYLLYVGKAGAGSSFRERYSDYLYIKRTLKKRPALGQALRKWEGFIRFCYVSIDQLNNIDVMEQTLLNACVPPFNRTYYGRPKSAIVAFKWGQ